MFREPICQPGVLADKWNFDKHIRCNAVDIALPGQCRLLRIAGEEINFKELLILNGGR